MRNHLATYHIISYHVFLPSLSWSIVCVIINSFLQRCPADASAPPLDTPLTAAVTSSLPNGAVHYFESFCIDRFGVRNLPTTISHPSEAEAWDIPLYDGAINMVPLPIPKDKDGRNDFGILSKCFKYISCLPCVPCFFSPLLM